ncbi:MAG TPA: dihydroorotase [Bacillus sp. (in: firmicutes)]|uniref:dihydroorotase n=1 Tax=Bacillus litorisediminis TaxID=2922713 RepID=UPI001FAF17BF|nr:dihydroorotase [Bacillus litorisediminis]HWO77886.1 dihydroorotase [Bacillus sp. (in: firmicutes)]
MKTLLKNVQWLDGNKIIAGDVLIEENKVAAMGQDLSKTSDAEKVIDGNSRFIFPGFVDLHVHLRQPGGEHKETIETGTMAAARGGFTTIAPMPNTKPVPDSRENVESLFQLINKYAKVRVLPYASITVAQKGEELVDFKALNYDHVLGFTDDGVGVQSAGMMYEAMKQAAQIEKPIIAHCEDNTLICRGSFHDGMKAKELGVNGIPSICEAVHIARDVLLAEAAKCHYHVCHVSTKESVRVIRDAKKAGIRVTAEVTPHHLLLTEDDIKEPLTSYKMNPPLRAKEDRDALIEGLLDGTIDFIATDHAPHTQEEKAKELDQAPFGIVGLETAFPLLYTHFVEKGVFTLKQLVDWLTVRPSEAFGLTFGRLQIGAIADLVLVDVNEERQIDVETFLSKGKNTPFHGWNCKGWPVMTFVNGKLVYSAEGVVV